MVQVRKRRSKTQNLSEQLRHLAQVLEAYDEGVALFDANDPKLRILFVNEALLSLTGAHPACAIIRISSSF